VRDNLLRYPGGIAEAEMFSFAYSKLEGAMVGVYHGEFEGDRDHQRLLDLLDREDTGTRYRLYRKALAGE
jgi:hypothetical protein